jgi:hypothetical protein
MDIDYIITLFSSLLLIENENKAYSILDMIYLSFENINKSKNILDYDIT